MSDVRVRFLKLEVLDEYKRKKIIEAVDRVLHHGRIVLGPEVEKLEKKIADYCGVRFAVGVDSGTDAVYLALRSLDIGPGDEVITTCLSWIATANAISLTGAKPIFIDINDDFTTLSEKLAILGAKLVINLGPQFKQGKVSVKPQRDQDASFTNKFKREDGRID